MWIESADLFPQPLLGALTAHAERAFPHECIGFVVRKGGSLWSLPMPAVASERHVHIAPDVLIQAAYALADGAAEVVAMYHSHPLGQIQLSSFDDSFAAWSDTHILLARVADDWRALVYRYISSSRED